MHDKYARIIYIDIYIYIYIYLAILCIHIACTYNVPIVYI